MTKDAEELLNDFGSLITWDDIKKARESEIKSMIIIRG